ncbi:MAG: hypothetical protein M3P06_21545 [Acidobacteriota bacterium]|nr:hypothetical protein [Acidobacteriota bacterium]
MTLHIVLLTAALLAVGVIFVRGFRRGPSIKLPPSMILTLRITLGIIFFILGIIGSLLPIMQGWIFFLLAALVLFPRSRFAVKACQKIEPKMPRMVARLRRWGIGIPPEDRDTIQT